MAFRGTTGAEKSGRDGQAGWRHADRELAGEPRRLDRVRAHRGLRRRHGIHPRGSLSAGTGGDVGLRRANRDRHTGDAHAGQDGARAPGLQVRGQQAPAGARDGDQGLREGRSRRQDGRPRSAVRRPHRLGRSGQGQPAARLRPRPDGPDANDRGARGPRRVRDQDAPHDPGRGDAPRRQSDRSGTGDQPRRGDRVRAARAAVPPVGRWRTSWLR